MADDVALLARVAGPRSCHLLAERHAPQLHRIAWRITGDMHEAEDISQESLLRPWDQPPSWQEGRTSLAAWLCRVAVNRH
ncbi:hypothetical protein M3P36_00135 [Altererythrobacter sp. KTW20L]|uniref:sigma factor n=1 Tax=Altererythrobacter sp. KTW20L TaxID=2942210 RepID=UPI0020BEC652|nr:hypothetical protein [Altererythrobacter sp. KTW20L]